MFKDKRGYVYRKERVGGRVITKYLGRAKKGSAAEQLLKEDGKQRKEEASRKKSQQERLSEITRLLDATIADVALVCEGSELLLRSALVLAGYHQHARGQWRRKRVPAGQRQQRHQRPQLPDATTDTEGVSSQTYTNGGGNLMPRLKKLTTNESPDALAEEKARAGDRNGEQSKSQSTSAEDGATSGQTGIVPGPDTGQAPAPIARLDRQEIRRLFVEARYDAVAASQLMAHLQRTDSLEAYGNTIRNVASNARQALLELCHPNNQLSVMVMEKRLKEMQEELAGPDATALEKQLSERIVLCWLQVHYFEAMFAENASNQEVVTLFQSRIDAAHRRHLSAIKALALVRKMQIPVLQFNLAEKQVNIGNVGNIGSMTSDAMTS